MFILPGSSALSAPRYQALQGALGEVDPGLAVQDVFFVYAVDHSGPVDRSKLAGLLQPGTAESPRPSLPDGEQCQYVVPRLGTISPVVQQGNRYCSQLWL